MRRPPEIITVMYIYEVKHRSIHSVMKKSKLCQNNLDRQHMRKVNGSKLLRLCHFLISLVGAVAVDIAMVLQGQRTK